MMGSDNPGGDSHKTPSPGSPAGESTAGQDGTLRAAIFAVAATAIVLTGGAFAFRGSGTAVGVAIGGALATANLIVLARIGQSFVHQKGRTAPWAAVAAIKLIVLFAAVWLILRSGVASGLALAVGYVALPIGITMGSLFGPKPSESPPLETPPDTSAAEPLVSPTPPDAPHADVLEAGRREAHEPPAESR